MAIADFFLRRTTLQQKTKAFSGLSTRDSLYQCLLWQYVHLVLYCFCIHISNTKWSNTWYHIHSISAGISHHYQSAHWSFSQRELKMSLIVRSKPRKDLPKISCYITGLHQKCSSWRKGKGKLASLAFIQTSHRIHLWVLGSLIKVDIHSYESAYY